MKNIRFHFHFCLWILIIGICGCQKEQIVLISPSITIASAKTTALTTYNVVVKINKGEGQEVQKAEVVFKDITVSSAPDIVREIQVNAQKEQIDTLVLQTDRLNHDYSVQASLKTNKYTYTSELQIIRSEKNRFSVDIVPNLMYSDLKNGIADFVNQENSFSLGIDYINVFKPQSVEVKLNRSISLKHSIDFENYYYSENIHCGGAVFIPKDLEPGIYEVYLYLDGIEIKAKNTIKVLKGTWEKIIPNFPGEPWIGEYAWVLKNDNVFLFGGSRESVQLAHSPVWKYNITNNLWESKRDFPHPGLVANNKIFSFQLQYNDQAYIVLKNNQSIEIWKYLDETDEWLFIAKYPGEAYFCLTSFTFGNKLYLGGGTRVNSNGNGENPYYDFWAYDFDNKAWEKKNNIPVPFYQSNGHGNLSCATQENDVFVFSYTNDLWQYHPESDTWSAKKKFPGPLRITSNLVEKDHKLYLIGGSYLNYGYYGIKDCWEYSILSDSWEMVAFMPQYYSFGIAFTFNNHIYSGLGWVINGYMSNDEQNFYQLDL